MAKQIIARVKLAPGEIGYYDSYSRLYLTMQNNIADIYSDTDCTQIKRSVASGRLLLLSGSFTEPIKPAKNMPAKEVKNTKAAPAMEIKEDTSVEIPDKSPIELHEEVVSEQEIFDEAVEISEEVKPQKRARRKKTENADKGIELNETVEEAEA